MTSNDNSSLQLFLDLNLDLFRVVFMINKFAMPLYLYRDK